MTSLPSTVNEAFSHLERLNEKSLFYRQGDIVGLKVDNRTVRWMRDTQDVTSQLFAYAGSVIAFFPCLAIGLGAEFLKLSRMTKITIMASAAAIAALCWYFSGKDDNSGANSPSGTHNSYTWIGGSTHNTYNTYNNPVFSDTSTSLPTESDTNAQNPEPVAGSAFDRAFNKSLATCALASGVVGASIGSVVSLVVVPPISGTVNAIEYMVSDYSSAPE